MNVQLKPALIAVAFLGLGVVAVSGWMRDPQPQSDGIFGQQQAYQQLVGYDLNGQPIYEQRGVYSTGMTLPGDSLNQPFARQTYSAQPPVQLVSQPVARQPIYRSVPEPAPVVQQRPVSPAPVRTSRVEQPQQPRSKKASAAIIAGGAGAGAAVGAIAGGGKGAAIGAISGGVGGLIYDQITRK